MNLAPEPTAAARLIAEQRAGQPDVVRLAQTLSLTAQAEPYVLREARLRFLPRSSAGLEAQLWFSPLVEAADSRALVLDAEVASELRGELAAGDRALLESVRGFTEEAHRDAPLAVRTFENLLWSATGPAAGTAEDGVGRALAPFLAHVLAGGAEALEASRWALRYLPRLPAAVRDCAPARRLRIAAAERLGLDLPATAGAPDDDARAVRRLVQGDVDIGVRVVPEGVVISRPPERDALVCQVSGAARARLRVRAALPGARWHRVDLGERQRAAVRLDVVVAARFDGTVDGGRAEPGDVVRSAWAGECGALAVTAAGRTELRVDAGGQVLVAELPGPPEVLAVADAVPPRAAAAGPGGLHVVTAALDGSAEVTRAAAEPVPAALGWTTVPGLFEDQVALCVAGGRHLRLLAEGDPARELLWHRHEDGVAHLWSSVRAALVAVADTAGRVVVHRAAPGGGLVAQTVCGPGPAVTALSGEPSTRTVLWADADGRVLRWRAEPDAEPAVCGMLPRPARALAVSAAAGLVVAADGRRRLHRLPWGTRRSGGPPPAAEPGTALPFAVDGVFAADPDRLVLAGSGGPVEIRSEDGRAHVVLPDEAVDVPSPGAPRWLAGSVGVALPGPPPAAVLRTARRAGVGHVFVAAGALAGRAAAGPGDKPGNGDADGDADALAAVAARARDAGLRALADVAPPGPGRTAADVLEEGRRLLDLPLDGLRAVAAARWPDGLLDDLRHLVDAFPQAALVATLDPAGPGEPSAAAHLTIGQVPALDAPPPAPGAGWALPDAGHTDTCRLLALPGLAEVPYALLAAEDPRATALRGLLAARSRQQPLLHGRAQSGATTEPDVAAVWRRYGGAAVLCLTELAGRARTVRVPAGPDEPELVEIAADTGAEGATALPPGWAGLLGDGTAPPAVLRPSGGVFAVPLGPNRTRWLSVWDSGGTRGWPDIHPSPARPSA